MTTSRISRKRNKKAEELSLKYSIELLNNNMAELNTKSTSSKSGSRKDSLEVQNQAESLDSGKLLDNLERLERIKNVPSTDEKSSPSR